ncbi:MAG TPA: ribonuclease Z [Bacteroidales bacterium]
MSFSVTILGSSSALPTSNRYLTAHLLNVNERFFLIDCGEGTQFQLRRYKAKFSRLDHIFITHLHGDHVFGLPGLISTFNLLGRKNALHIYSHPHLEKILHQFLSNFYADLDFPVVYHTLNLASSELVFEDDKLEVLSFPLKHRIPTCGFVFREKPRMRNIRKDMIDYYKIPIREIPNVKRGEDFITEEGIVIPNGRLTFESETPKSYAFCSDTAYSTDILPYIREVDLLYHEATFSDTDRDRAIETFHSTASDAARIALQANPKKLIIGHFSARYKDITQLGEEARKIFINTDTAEDGMVITL